MTSLSTHVLDTTYGKPASGVVVRLYTDDLHVFSGTTDADGRCPALREYGVRPGLYRLEFEVAAYFRSLGVDLPDPPFLGVVRIDFGISDGHYHVPLLVSPYGYSTYRGS